MPGFEGENKARTTCCVPNVKSAVDSCVLLSTFFQPAQGLMQPRSAHAGLGHPEREAGADAPTLECFVECILEGHGAARVHAL